MVDLKVVVTGTGRCGTVFMANVLTSMGWPCGHEAVFGPNGIETAKKILKGELSPVSSEISRSDYLFSDGLDLVGDSSYMSAPFLKELDAAIIHLVRNPMNVVASLIGGVFRNFSQPFPTDFPDQPDHILYERFMYENLPELGEEMTQLDRGCLFYLKWNEMIEASGKVDIFQRVEDPPDKIRKLMSFQGECFSEQTCNSFSSSSRKWLISEIESPSIKRGMRDIMKRYGYKESGCLL